MNAPQGYFDSSLLEDRDYAEDHFAPTGAPKAALRSGKSAAAFRTISEVADELGLQQHVLRFWETKFSQVRPLKRGGGRRYYRPEDVALLKSIHHLLHTEGYTIKGVQKLLRDVGKKKLIEANLPPEPEEDALIRADEPVYAAHIPLQIAVNQDIPLPAPVGLTEKQRGVLEDILADLKSLREFVAR